MAWCQRCAQRHTRYLKLRSAPDSLRALRAFAVLALSRKRCTLVSCEGRATCRRRRRELLSMSTGSLSTSWLEAAIARARRRSSVPFGVHGAAAGNLRTRCTFSYDWDDAVKLSAWYTGRAAQPGFRVGPIRARSTAFRPPKQPAVRSLTGLSRLQVGSIPESPDNS